MGSGDDEWRRSGMQKPTSPLLHKPYPISTALKFSVFARSMADCKCLRIFTHPTSCKPMERNSTSIVWGDRLIAAFTSRVKTWQLMSFNRIGQAVFKSCLATFTASTAFDA